MRWFVDSQRAAGKCMELALKRAASPHEIDLTATMQLRHEISERQGYPEALWR
jgi:hypothetical protein